MDQVMSMTGPQNIAFHAPTGHFRTVLVLPNDTNVLDVLDIVIKEYVAAFAVDVDAWDIGKRGEGDNFRPGTPSVEELARFRLMRVNNAYLRGRFDDKDALASVHILGDESEKSYDSSGYADCVTIVVKSSDLESDKTPARTRRLIDGHYALVRALLARYSAMRAHILRYTNSYAPVPPHADPHRLLEIVYRSEIAESYDNPEVYWQAWDKVEPLDAERVLVSRALDIVDELVFKQAIYPRTWGLARQARPKLTKYYAPDLRDFDTPHVDGPDAVVNAAGYHPQEHCVEYTAYAPGDTHILPREILAFSKWLSEGKMSNGQPLKEIRVTFVDHWTAMKERRPLLDIGCRVFYYEKDGALLELKDV